VASSVFHWLRSSPRYHGVDGVEVPASALMTVPPLWRVLLGRRASIGVCADHIGPRATPLSLTLAERRRGQNQRAPRAGVAPSLAAHRSRASVPSGRKGACSATST